MNLREWALPVYTILVQLATGALLVLWVIRTLETSKHERQAVDQMIGRPILIIFFTVLTAMLGSHSHLSKPFLSFLAVLNIKSSWLSREILFTVLFFLALGGLVILQWFVRNHARFQTILGWIAIGFGGASIFCMSSIYLLPTQPAWNSPLTHFFFFATTVLVGMIALFAMLVMDLRFSEVRERADQRVRTLIIQRTVVWIAAVAVVAAILIVGLNLYQIFLLQSGDELARMSVDLLLGLYQPLFAMRLGLLGAGVGCFLVAAVLIVRRRKTISELMGLVYVALLLVLVAEILGRFLFYAIHIRLGL